MSLLFIYKILFLSFPFFCVGILLLLLLLFALLVAVYYHMKILTSNIRPINIQLVPSVFKLKLHKFKVYSYFNTSCFANNSCILGDANTFQHPRFFSDSADVLEKAHQEQGFYFKSELLLINAINPFNVNDFFQ